jgi:hypothetical protein
MRATPKEDSAFNIAGHCAPCEIRASDESYVIIHDNDLGVKGGTMRAQA